MAGDFNAHRPSWDRFAREDERGEKVEEWLTERALVTLKYGSATRYSRAEGGARCSAPDLTVVRSEVMDQFSWTPLHKLQSDHLPLKIVWNRQYIAEKMKS